MNNAEAFKIGFLLKCAEDGCSEADVHVRISRLSKMTKSGNWLTDAGGTALKYVGGIAPSGSDIKDFITKWLLPKTIIGAVAGPPALGALAGYGVAQMQSGEFKPEDAQREEELATTYDAINQLKQVKKRKEKQLATV